MVACQGAGLVEGRGKDSSLDNIEFQFHRMTNVSEMDDGDDGSQLHELN